MEKLTSYYQGAGRGEEGKGDEGTGHQSRPRAGMTPAHTDACAIPEEPRKHYPLLGDMHISQSTRGRVCWDCTRNANRIQSPEGATGEPGAKPGVS